MSSVQFKVRAAIAPVRALFVSEGNQGLLLMAVAVVAMTLANTPLSAGYEALFHAPLGWTPVPKLTNLHLWINDAVMVLFFFVVGLEVKREMVEGDLSERKSRRLPLIAAASGMVIPAVVFIAVVGNDSLLTRGWAIPAATDIAFAVGVLGLLGSRVPASLRLFLLTVAIIDDIGAVIVIALFYTAQIKVTWFLAAVGVTAGLALLNMRRIDSLWPYIAGAALLWLCVLHSGVHATIAGVVAALTVPMRRRDRSPLLARVEHRLAPWSAYLVVPVFALANAGVDLRGMELDALWAPLPLGIAAGLFLGKQAGILAAIAGARRLGIAHPPRGATWLQIWGVTVLCGIGFTMSLFIATLAFADHPALFEEAKLGVLGGTLMSLVVGYVILRFAPQSAGADLR